jgi:hypothetical protein
MNGTASRALFEEPDFDRATARAKLSHDSGVGACLGALDSVLKGLV